MAAAGVVAWQSFETRRSANASNEAVETANAGLDLARQQHREAVRTRIDAATPAIGVRVGPEVEWPPLQPSIVGGTPNALPVGPGSPVMRMPRDGAKLVMVQAKVTLFNGSDSHVALSLSGLLDDNGGALPTHLLLAPSESREVWCASQLSLAEWVNVYQSRTEGRDGGDRVVANVTYIDPGDTGVIDRWDLVMGGTVVESAPLQEGGWLLIDAPRPVTGEVASMGIGVPIRHRTYYLSRSRNEILPD